MRRLLLTLTVMFTGILAATSLCPSPAHAAKVYDGVIRIGCPQADGKETFDILLSNNAKASIYASLKTIEQSGTSASYGAVNGDVKDGGAILTKCDRQGRNCRQKPGQVSITMFEGDTVTGVIQIALAGWGRAYNGSETDMFKVKYDRTYKPACK